MKKLLAVFGVVFIGFFLFSAGLDAGQHFYRVMALDLIEAAFFLSIGALITISEWQSAVAKARHESHREEGEKLAKDLVKALDEAFKPSKEIEHDTELAGAIAKDVLQGEKREATPEEVARIEQAFHDQTDGEKYLKIHNSSNEGMEMEISAEPIEQVPGRSQAHEEARVRGDTARSTKIPVIDGDAPEKPLTKSQQRRLNTKKGLGPLTDDEVREQKNAKRRADRAAKKAASDTTTTTTQPGQTSLV